MKTAVLVFPGSNCDHDAYHALKYVVGVDAEFVWHKRSSLDGFDAVVIPGGFTYGDYLRTGAMAKLSPVMGAVRRFAEGGGPVIGICNGFQVLTEAGLLPGALQKNSGLRFATQVVKENRLRAKRSLQKSGSQHRCRWPNGRTRI